MKNTTIKATSIMLIFFLFLSCNSDEKIKVTNKEDYQAFLIVKENEKENNIKREIDFWQTKYNAAPNQYTYLISLASLYSQLFEIKGNIQDLYRAEKLLLDCNNRVRGEKASIHRSIAKNYISQHQFKEALEYLKKAYILGENRLSTEKMLFDVYMELGNYTEAEKKLDVIQDTKDFDYLIRLAKWNDHKGDLDTAIKIMEQAKKIAEETKKEDLKLWIYSNIADFYGHAGRIKESYDYYLKTLQIDNQNAYALKGIAWIVFSYERDTKSAIEIIDHITAKHTVPDLYLLRAEMNEFATNYTEQKLDIEEYFKLLNNHNYGDMYNKYNALLYSEVLDNSEKAIEIAKKEIQNRPTPESYDLLAWAYYQNGDFDEALKIVKKHTMNKSQEPLILFHNEMILKANDMLTKENSNKEELLSSIYELGPNLEILIMRI
ncbi:tetratricopeptide repeat protein [Flavobacterium sp. 316]|uniref:tetratricopeptide repeat protein n=1 Tax=Flavobacterium sp. 316 TaxID=1603293 RepID=UPI0006976547|nr:tetratricopeptide repeat protein [Flavobacterium sp. 316]